MAQNMLLREGLTPTYSAADLVEPYDNEFVKGVRRGSVGVESSITSLGAAITDMFNREAAAKKYAEAAALQQEIARRNPAATGHLKDIKGLGSALDYFGGALGEALPSMTAGLGGGLLGTRMAQYYMPKLVASNSMAAPFIGSMAAAAPIEAGEAAMTYANDPVSMANSTPGERLGLSSAKGLINGALESIVPATLAGKVVPSNLTKVPLSQSLGHIRNAALTGGLQEGATEGLQEIVGGKFHQQLNPSHHIDPWDVADAAAKGFAPGATFGSAGGAVDVLTTPGSTLVELGKKGVDKGVELGKKGVAAVAGMTKEGVKAGIGAGFDKGVDLTKDGIQKVGEWVDKLPEAAGVAADKIDEVVTRFTSKSKSESESKNLIDEIRKNHPDVDEALGADTLNTLHDYFKDAPSDELKGSFNQFLTDLRDKGLDGLTEDNFRSMDKAIKLATAKKEVTKHLDDSLEETYSESTGRSGKKLHNAIRQAFINSGANDEFINTIAEDVARRVQIRDLVKDGNSDITKVINEAVIDALRSSPSGIGMLYNPDVPGGVKKLSLLKKAVQDHVIPEVTKTVSEEIVKEEETPDISIGVKSLVDRLYQSFGNTPEGKKLLTQSRHFSSPEGKQFLYDKWNELITKVATGESNGNKLAKTMHSVFGESLTQSALTEIEGLVGMSMGKKSAEKIKQMSNRASWISKLERHLVNHLTDEADKSTEPVTTSMILQRMAKDLNEVYGAIGNYGTRPSGVTKDQLTSTRPDKGIIQGFGVQQSSQIAKLLNQRLNEFNRGREATPITKEKSTVPPIKYGKEGAVRTDTFEHADNVLRGRWASLIKKGSFERVLPIVHAYLSNKDALTNSAISRMVIDEKDVGASVRNREQVSVADRTFIDDDVVTNEDGITAEDGVVTTSDVEADKLRIQSENETSLHSKTEKVMYIGAGSDIHSEKHDYDKVSPPLSAHTSSDYEFSEYSQAVDGSNAIHGHRVMDTSRVRPIEWAQAESKRTGKSEESLLYEAMEALLKHDAERTKNIAKINDPQTVDDIKYIEARSDLASKFKEWYGKNAGLAFFDSPLLSSHYYYRMGNHDGSNLKYTLEQLAYGYSNYSSRTQEAFILKLLNRWGAKDTPENRFIIEDSLIKVKIYNTEKPLEVDLPTLIERTVRGHQQADVSSTTDTTKETHLFGGDDVFRDAGVLIDALGSEEDVRKALAGQGNIAKALYQTVMTVLGTIQLTKGVHSVQSIKKGSVVGTTSVEAMLKRAFGNETYQESVWDKDGGKLVHKDVERGAIKKVEISGLAPNTVIVRKFVNGKAFVIRFGDIQNFALDEEGKAIFKKGAIGQMMQSDVDGIISEHGVEKKYDPSTAARHGIALKALRVGSKTYDVDFRKLLNHMRDRYGMEYLLEKNKNLMTTELATVLMMEGFHDLINFFKAKDSEKRVVLSLIPGARGEESDFLPHVVVFEKHGSDRRHTKTALRNGAPNDIYGITFKDIHHLMVNIETNSDIGRQTIKLASAKDLVGSKSAVTKQVAKDHLTAIVDLINTALEARKKGYPDKILENKISHFKLPGGENLFSLTDIKDIMKVGEPLGMMDKVNKLIENIEFDPDLQHPGQVSDNLMDLTAAFSQKLTSYDPITLSQRLGEKDGDPLSMGAQRLHPGRRKMDDVIKGQENSYAGKHPLSISDLELADDTPSQPIGWKGSEAFGSSYGIERNDVAGIVYEMKKDGIENSKILRFVKAAKNLFESDKSLTPKEVMLARREVQNSLDDVTLKIPDMILPDTIIQSLNGEAPQLFIQRKKGVREAKKWLDDLSKAKAWLKKENKIKAEAASKAEFEKKRADRQKSKAEKNALIVEKVHADAEAATKAKAEIESAAKKEGMKVKAEYLAKQEARAKRKADAEEARKLLLRDPILGNSLDVIANMLYSNIVAGRTTFEDLWGDYRNRELAKEDRAYIEATVKDMIEVQEEIDHESMLEAEAEAESLGEAEQEENETFSQSSRSATDNLTFNTLQDVLKARLKELIGDLGGVTLVEDLERGGKQVAAVIKAANEILINFGISNQTGTLDHEAWHAVENLLKAMGKPGEKILESIYSYVMSKHTQEWIINKLDSLGDAGAVAQLTSADTHDVRREFAAYAFQLKREGYTLPPSVVQGKFAKIIKFAKDMLAKIGVTFSTKGDQTEAFFNYLEKGGFLRDNRNPQALLSALNRTKADKFVDSIKTFGKEVSKAIEPILSNTANRLKEYGIKPYNDLVELWAGKGGKGGYQNNFNMELNRWSNHASDLLKNLDLKEREAFANSDEYRKFIKTFKNYMSNVLGPNEASNVIDRLEAFDSKKVNENFDEFMADLAAHGGVKGDVKAIAQIIADSGFYDVGDQKLFKGEPEVLRKWQTTDSKDWLARLVFSGVRAAERARTFGKDDVKLKELMAKGDALANGEQKALAGKVFSAYEGQLGQGQMSRELMKLSGMLMTANNIRLLPFAIFAQLMEPLQLALRKNDFGAGFGALFRGIKEMPRTFNFINKRVEKDYWERFSEFHGTVVSDIMGDVLGLQYNGIKLNGLSGWMNDKFFKYNFMQQWDRSMRIAATKHAVEFLIDHGVGKINPKHSERFLKELGLTEEMIKQKVKVLDEGGSTLELGSDDVSKEIQRAINQYVSESLAHPDAGSNALWMNDPRFALIAHMKRFTFAFTKYVLGRGLNELKHGNYFPLIPTVIAIPWMLTSDAFKDFVKPGDEAYKNNWGFTDYLTQGVERAGLLGKMEFPESAIKSQYLGGNAIESLLGPTAGLVGSALRGAGELKSESSGRVDIEKHANELHALNSVESEFGYTQEAVL